MLTADTTVTRSLLAASNRVPPSYQDGALPGELKRHGWDAWIRTTVARAKTWRPAASRHPIESPRQVLPPASRSYKERPVVGPGGGSHGFANAADPGDCMRRTNHATCVLGAIRTHTAGRLMAVPPAVGLRGHGASGRPRTAYLRLTRTPLCQVSYRGTSSGSWGRTNIARFRALHPAIRRSRISADGEIRTRTHTGFEPAVSAVGLRPLECAARESNPVPLGKGQLHSQHARSA
jgi:hypothetical protein